MPEFFRIDAVHFGDKMADESFLIEGSVVGTEEVVAGPEETVVIHLWQKKILFRSYFKSLLVFSMRLNNYKLYL